jgi:hypothetical protein
MAVTDKRSIPIHLLLHISCIATATGMHSIFIRVPIRTHALVYTTSSIQPNQHNRDNPENLVGEKVMHPGHLSQIDLGGGRAVSDLSASS